MEVTPRYKLFTLLTLLTLFILFKLLYTACLYIWLGKVRMLLEWADGLLSKILGLDWTGLDWMDGWIPLRLLVLTML